jgi:hypothetical protein
MSCRVITTGHLIRAASRIDRAPDPNQCKFTTSALTALIFLDHLVGRRFNDTNPDDSKVLSRCDRCSIRDRILAASFAAIE